MQKREAILFFQHDKMFFLTLTECDAVDLRPLGVRQVPVHLLDDFLFHLWNGVTVQYLDGCDIWTLVLHQHLQSLGKKKKKKTHTHNRDIKPKWKRVCVCTQCICRNKLATVSEPSHPAKEPYPHALSGWCCHDNRASVTGRHARCGDTWEDSCHLGQLMTSPQQGRALTRATSRITLSQLTDWQLEGFKH